MYIGSHLPRGEYNIYSRHPQSLENINSRLHSTRYTFAFQGILWQIWTSPFKGVRSDLIGDLKLVITPTHKNPKHKTVI